MKSERRILRHYCLKIRGDKKKNMETQQLATWQVRNWFISFSRSIWEKPWCGYLSFDTMAFSDVIQTL